MSFLSSDIYINIQDESLVCNHHAVCHTYECGNSSHVHCKSLGMRYDHIAITDIMNTEYQPLGLTRNIRFQKHVYYARHYSSLGYIVPVGTRSFGVLQNLGTKNP